MIRLMFKHNGYGLSAPQVGLNERIFVMRDPEDKTKGLVFINPIITELSSFKETELEGCLSFLSLNTRIERSWTVDFQFEELDEEAEVQTWHFEGLNARCVQHEIDHLNGITIADHFNSNMSRKLFLDRYMKAKKKHVRIG